MSRESKLLKNTAIIGIGNICTKCISFLMLPLYTSILTTAEYGTVDLISTYVSLLTAILTLQLEQGIFRFLIESRDDKEQQRKYITTSLYCIFMLNFLFLLIVIPVLKAVEYEYAYYLTICVIASSVNALIIQLHRGLGNNVAYSIASFLSGSANVLLNVLFVAILRRGIKGMLYANMLSLCISMCYSILKLKLWRYISYKNADISLLKELLRYSVPLIPNSLCWWIVNASDRLLLNLFIGVTANGIYSVACKFPSVFTMITNIFQLSWTESAAENIKDKSSSDYFRDIINKSIRLYSSCNIGIIACMPFLFGFLVKSIFEEAYYYIPILMTGALLHSVSSLYGSIYTALKMTKQIAYTTILSAILNIAINAALISKIGIYAAAISTLVSYLLITVIRYVDVNKRMKVDISNKYLFIECLVYILVFVAYYSQVAWIEIVVLVFLIPYCYFQNKNMLDSMAKSILKRIHKL